MLRIPFRCPKSNITYTETGHFLPELKLNDEWKLAFVYKAKLSFSTGQTQSTHSINICRQTTSEEMLVSGTLSYQYSGQAVSTQEFSKLIEPGSSFITINLNDPPPSITAFGFGQVSHLDLRNLEGIVYITSTDEKCATDLSNGECKNCTQLKSLVQLSNDFELLLDPQTSFNSDVNLKCGDVLIPAHKIILSTRSPVFAEEMENHENQLQITNMAPSVLRAMMVYIYTGKTSSLNVPSASDLLHAAHAYKLEDLKRVCCDFLKENASLQNVLSLLDLGDEYSEDLKSFAVDYFCNTCTDILETKKTEEWKTLCDKKPNLIIHVLSSPGYREMKN